MTAEEADRFIVAHFRKDMTAPQIAAALGWTHSHADVKVRVRAQRLGVAKPGVKRVERRTRMKELKRAVREGWEHRHAKDIAKDMGACAKTVAAVAADLRLPPKSGVNTGNIVNNRPEHRRPLPAARRPATSVFVVPPRQRPSREQAVDVLAKRARWDLEARMRPVDEVHCICGKPGHVYCDEHRALLLREGVL